MQPSTRARYLDVLLLVWKHKLEAHDALRYIEMIKEPPPGTPDDLFEVLSQIEIEHQAGRMGTHQDGRPTAQAIERGLGVRKQKARYYRDAYAVERLSLPPFDPDADQLTSEDDTAMSG